MTSLEIMSVIISMGCQFALVFFESGMVLLVENEEFDKMILMTWRIRMNQLVHRGFDGVVRKKL
jgi:hypothetical protein